MFWVFPDAHKNLLKLLRIGLGRMDRGYDILALQENIIVGVNLKSVPQVWRNAITYFVAVSFIFILWFA